MSPYANRERIAAYASAGLQALAMEFMPPITRAQSMDVLSSQANLAGYKAVLDAAGEYGRLLPMIMTAAGTIPAARVFVRGAAGGTMSSASGHIWRGQTWRASSIASATAPTASM